MQSLNFVSLIDSLGPINNAVRREKNAVKKLEYVWEMGLLIDNFIQINKLSLDKLLYYIYDPHATIKRSNITRSLASYSYRIFHFFQTKKDIHRVLPNIESYNVFIEAFPLLTNKKYTPYVKKAQILSLINSQESTRRIEKKLNQIKQSIIPTRKLKVSPKLIFLEEKQLLNSIINYIEVLYKLKNSISELINLKYDLNDIKYRKQLVSILMALSSDAFINKIKIWKEDEINNDFKNLYKVGISNNENRARFRKWVLSSSKLLWLAEAIHALSNDNDFMYFKRKQSK